MATSDKYANITTNQLVTKEILNDYIFTYGVNLIKSAFKQILPNAGVLNNKLQLSTVDTDSSNTSLTISGAYFAVDGLGNLIDTDSTYSYCTSVPVHATTVTEIDVAVRKTEGPAFGGATSNLRTNTKNGNKVEYVAYTEYIGEKGEPDAVSVIGSDVTLTVSSLCMSGQSFANRKCLVYLKSPVSIVESTAIKVLNISWDGVNNKVTISTDKLGQGTPSTVTSDYECIVLGPTLSDSVNNSLKNVSPYVYLGTLSAAAVWLKDVTDQNVYELNLDTIQETIDSFNREITVNYSGDSFAPGQKTAKGTSTTEHCSVVSSGIIYVFGGSDSSDLSTNTQLCYKYTPSSDSWLGITNFPDGNTSGMSAFVHNGKVYVIGGFGTSGTATAAVRIYDIAGNSWSSGSSCPTAMGRAIGSYYDGKIYYGAGQTERDVSATTLWYEYDIDGDSWTAKTSVPGNAAGGNAVLYSDKIYVIPGGSDAANINENNYTYDISSNSWSSNELPLFDTTNKKAPLTRLSHDTSYRFLGNAWVYNGFLFIWQGYNSTEITDDYLLYSGMIILDLTDLAKEPVFTILNFAPKTSGATMSIVDGKGFFIGGSTFSSWRGTAGTQDDWFLFTNNMCFDFNHLYRASKNLKMILPNMTLDISEDKYNLRALSTVSNITTERYQLFNLMDKRMYFEHSGATEDFSSSNNPTLFDFTGAMTFTNTNYNGTLFVEFRAGAASTNRYIIAISAEDETSWIAINSSLGSSNAYPRTVSGQAMNFDDTYEIRKNENVFTTSTNGDSRLNNVTGVGTAIAVVPDSFMYPGSKFLSKRDPTVNTDGVDYGWYSELEAMGCDSSYTSKGHSQFGYFVIHIEDDSETYFNEGDVYVRTLNGLRMKRVKNYTKNEIYRALAVETQEILIPKGHIYGDIYMSANWDFKYGIIGGE